MRFLDIQRGEAAKIAVTWAMCALLAVGYAIGWSAVHSMLVKRMGVEYLPYTYIGISLLGVFGSSVYLLFADAVRRDRLLVIFAGATGLTLVLARLLVTSRPEGEKGFTLPLLLFFLAVFFAQGVGNSTLGTQVWTIINDIFRPSQGRRIYPILGTAGTIGGIAGGASIHFLASSLGTANLVLIWAASIWALIPLTLWLRKRFGGELRGRRSATPQPRGGHLREGWKFIKSSKLAAILGFVAVMFWVVGSVADYQYTRIMNASFPTESKLAGFYGVYGMVINTSGLFVQIFFSGYLIRRIGIARGLCALPLTVLGGFVLIAARFAFWPGVALRYTWDMIGMTVQGNSYQLAMNAIPAALRARIRGFIDGVVNPLGGILGGILILSLHHLFDSTGDRGWADPVTLAGLVLAVGWLIVVSRSGKIYLNTVSENLRSPEKRTAMDAIDCLEEHGNPRAEELLDEVACLPDPEKRAAAARVRGAIHSHSTLRALAGSCADPSPQVRREAIRALSRVPRHLPLPDEAADAATLLIESDPDPSVRTEALNFLILREPPASAGGLAARWLKHGSTDVRVRIVEALATLGNDKHALLEQCLSDPAPAVRAAAVCALWNDERWRGQAESALAALASEPDPSAHAPTLAACHRTGSCPDQALPMRLLGSPDPVARVLAGAAVLRFHTDDPAARGRALEAIFQTLAEEAHAGILRTEVLPLVPDLGEDAADSILLAAAKLPADEKSRVSKVLGEWYQVLDARIGTPEL
ncbi:MAG: MFS transporter [Verrucomicrobiota bacterium]